MLRNTPYTNFHNLNLDWIMRKLKLAVYAVNGQPPDEDGNVELEVTSGVVSVNGQTGDVELTAADVDALPDSYTPPVQSVNNKTGAVVLNASDVGALPDSYTPPVQSVNGQTGNVVIGIPNMQIGTSSAITAAAGAISSVDITFPIEFNSAPRFVMAQLYAPNISTTRYRLGALAIFETALLTKAAVRFRIANASQESIAPDDQYPIYIKWLAIE